MVYSLCQWFSNYIIITWRTYQNRLLDPIPRASNLVDLEWISKICTFNKFPDIAGTAGMRIVLREPMVQRLGMASDKQAEHEIWGQINGDPP